MSDESDLNFCIDAALHVVNGRAIVSGEDGVSYQVTAENGKLKEYRRLPGRFATLSIDRVSETDEEVLEFWEQLFDSPLERKDGKPVTSEDIAMVREKLKLLYADVMRESGDIH